MLSTAKQTQAGKPERGVVAVSTSLCVHLGQELQYDPDPVEGNPAHTLILGKKSRSVARKFAMYSEMWITPTQPP